MEKQPEIRPKTEIENTNTVQSQQATMQTGGNFVPTQPTEESMESQTNTITPAQQEDYQRDATVEPVPAQNQLPVDSYLYANTSSIGGVVQSVADQYNLDPHKLEALTNTIRNQKANLSGFYNMQIGYYPGMSAESLITQLGRVADLSNTITDRENQEAQMKGLKPSSNGLDKIIDSLQSIDGKQAGKYYYQEALNALQEADHMKFDNQTLTQYYETLIQSGASKADAWTRTMQAQDRYRAVQSKRAINPDFDNMVSPAEMSTYVANLYEKVQNTKDPETKLLLYGQYQYASQLAKQYTEAFKADPAAYLQAKDPLFKSLLTEASKTGDFSSIVATLDRRYEELGVPQSQRKYLRDDQVKAAAKEINTFLASDPIKAQSILVGLNQSYGAEFGKVVNQLIADGKVSSEAKVLVEAIKTGSPVSNEDVLTMMKYKLNYKGGFAKEMLGAPDNTTANTMMRKLEARIYDLPGYRALVNQLNLNGNVTGKIEMAQYYADMAALYKYKNPRLSDKQAVEMVQRNLIDSVYTYDPSGRVILQQRTLDNKRILYGKYDVPQTKNYLANRQFTGQHLQIGEIDLKTSEQMLKDNSKIVYITKDQFTVQPVYVDINGVTQALFKTDKNGKPYRDGQGNKIAYTINLKHIGEEEVTGIFDAKESLRKLTSVLCAAANIPSPQAMARGVTGPIDNNTASTMKALTDLGFDLKNFDTTKSFNQQFDRTKMEPRRIEALTNVMIKQNQFELKLEEYRKLQKAQRDSANYLTAAKSMIKPFMHDMIFNPKTEADSQLVPYLKNYEDERNKLKPSLKQTRQELYELEADIMKEATIFLNYKGNLPKHPLMDQIQYHGLTDKILWGGY